jgi:hypothetical protein
MKLHEKVTITEKEKVIIEKIETKSIVLELSMEEAKVLAFLVRQIGGSPTMSYRKYTEDMQDKFSSHFKLNGAVGYEGTPWYSAMAGDFNDPHTGYFADRSETDMEKLFK